jgi:formylmethanofuran dehydrogenase subunit A
MRAKYDVAIRGGTIIDGTGSPAYGGDIGILDGRIASIGKLVDEGADRVIDAEGCAVTPGFVDIHTHYDAQAIWSDRLVPISDAPIALRYYCVTRSGEQIPDAIHTFSQLLTAALLTSWFQITACPHS